MKTLTKEAVDRIGREFMERGLIVAAGWEGYKLMFPMGYTLTPSEREHRERRAFFAGAQHLFSAIMNSGLDEGAEPTDADLRRMDNIANELRAFEEQLLRESTH